MMGSAKIRHRRRRRAQRVELLQDIDEQLRLDRPAPIRRLPKEEVRAAHTSMIARLKKAFAQSEGIDVKL
jgi:hypothetical protein